MKSLQIIKYNLDMPFHFQELLKWLDQMKNRTHYQNYSNLLLVKIPCCSVKTEAPPMILIYETQFHHGCSVMNIIKIDPQRTLGGKICHIHSS